MNVLEEQINFSRSHHKICHKCSSQSVVLSQTAVWESSRRPVASTDVCCANMFSSQETPHFKTYGYELLISCVPRTMQRVLLCLTNVFHPSHSQNGLYYCAFLLINIAPDRNYWRRRSHRQRSHQRHSPRRGVWWWVRWV